MSTHAVRLLPISGQYIRHNDGTDVLATNSNAIGGISQRQLRSLESNFTGTKLGRPVRLITTVSVYAWKACAMPKCSTDQLAAAFDNLPLRKDRPI